MADITIPLPPSVNAAYGGGSKQKRFKSKAYKEWLSKLYGIHISPLNTKRLEYMFYFPDKRTRDIANYEKLTTDFLVKSGAVKDDDWRYITELRLLFGGIDKENPRVEINGIF